MIATPDPDHPTFRQSDRLTPHDLADLIDTIAFEPQAVVDEDINELADRAKSPVVEGSDDLDFYSGIGFMLGEMPVAVMHYRGHPEHTSTIYLPFEVQMPRRVKRAIALVMKDLRIPSQRLRWQRWDAVPR